MYIQYIIYFHRKETHMKQPKMNKLLPRVPAVSLFLSPCLCACTLGYAILSTGPAESDAGSRVAIAHLCRSDCPKATRGERYPFGAHQVDRSTLGG